MDAPSGSAVARVPLSIRQSSSISTTTKAQIREKAKRPQLSCNPCRQRKVKCDRVQPCTACSLHQIADTCDYDLTESERRPILQAEALKEKDKKIERLQEEIQMLQGRSFKSEQIEEDSIFPRSESEIQHQQRAIRPTHTHQGLQNDAFDNNIYFGCPSMAAVAQELANLSIHRRPGSLTHSTRIAPATLALQHGPLYPFPMLLPSFSETASLINVLPPEAVIESYLVSFQNRAQAFSFSHISGTCTLPEVKRFLYDVDHGFQIDLNMLALLLATLAQGLQNGVYDRCGQTWITGEVEKSYQQGNIWVAASMQALRNASFLSRPNLLAIETLILICSYLTNSGRLLDAWALLGTAIRLAQGIGLHRDPYIVDPSAPPDIMTKRKALWWSLLHIDQQYSLTLGRPLGISSIGDCPNPEPSVSDGVAQKLATFYDTYSTLGRRILSTAYMTDQHVISFTYELLQLPSTLPDFLRFDEMWLDMERTVPPWPLDAQAAIVHAKIHIYMLLLNRQHSECGSNVSHETNDTAFHNVDLRGRERVLDSCRGILHAFNFLHTRCRAALIDWTMTQHSFNASMLLTLSMYETNDTHDLQAVRLALTAFEELSKLGIHRLAGAAVEMLRGLIRGDEQPKDTVMGQQGMYILETSGVPVFQEEIAPFHHHHSVPHIFSHIPSKHLTSAGLGSDGAGPSSPFARPSIMRRLSKTHHHPKASLSSSALSGGGVGGSGNSRHTSSSSSKKAVAREKRLPTRRKLSESGRRSPKMSSKQATLLQNTRQAGDISLCIPDQRTFEHVMNEGSSVAPSSQNSAQTPFPTPIGDSLQEPLPLPTEKFEARGSNVPHMYHDASSKAYPFPTEAPQQQVYAESALSSGQVATQFNTPTDSNFSYGAFNHHGDTTTRGGFTPEGTASGPSSSSSAFPLPHLDHAFKYEFDADQQRVHSVATEAGDSPHIWAMGQGSRPQHSISKLITSQMLKLD